MFGIACLDLPPSEFNHLETLKKALGRVEDFYVVFMSIHKWLHIEPEIYFIVDDIGNDVSQRKVTVGK